MTTQQAVPGWPWAGSSLDLSEPICEVPCTALALGHFIRSIPAYHKGVSWSLSPFCWWRHWSLKNLSNLPKVTSQSLACESGLSDLDITHPFVMSKCPHSSERSPSLLYPYQISPWKNSWPISSLSLHIPVVISLTDRPGKLWKWCLLFPTSHHPSPARGEFQPLGNAHSQTIAGIF